MESVVGKKAVVTFRGDSRLLVVRADGDKIAPAMIQTQQGAVPASLPFVIGKITEVTTQNVTIEYTERDVLGPDGDASKKYVSVIARETIANITYAIESRVTIIGG